MNVTQEDLDNYLEHFGVKGMKWGVRKDGPSDVPRATNKEAAKDANELARAKMFYGPGAGNRRKLIKASTEAKSKKDPLYAKALDYHLGKQDMSIHADKARHERKSADRKKAAKQVAGMQARKLTGEMGTSAAFAAVTLAGAAYLRSPSGKAHATKLVGQAKAAMNSRKRKQVTDFLTDYFGRNA